MTGYVLMRRLKGCLVPADALAEEWIDKVKMGESVLVKPHRSRSGPQHNLFFAILSHVAEATQYETKERLLIALKIHLGRYDAVQMLNGTIAAVPHSISFEDMGQDDFQAFFDQAIKAICEIVLPGMSSQQLIDQVQASLGSRDRQRKAG